MVLGSLSMEIITNITTLYPIIRSNLHMEVTYISSSLLFRIFYIILTFTSWFPGLSISTKQSPTFESAALNASGGTYYMLTGFTDSTEFAFPWIRVKITLCQWKSWLLHCSMVHFIRQWKTVSWIESTRWMDGNTIWSASQSHTKEIQKYSQTLTVV